MTIHPSARLVCAAGLVLAGCEGSAAAPSGEAGVDSRAGDADAGPSASVDASLPPGTCELDVDCDDGQRCNGPERCVDGGCRPGQPAPDGTRCDFDDNASTREVCSSGRCSPSYCGDLIVDPSRGEECEDGNRDPDDGCRGCHFRCDDDADCGPCRKCVVSSHRCIDAPDGWRCAPGASCVSGVCLPSRCSDDADCDDGNPCNGAERCRDGRCEVGPPPDCDDGNPCTEDVCSPSAGGCTNILWDFDRDGQASVERGPCGTDCDDESAVTYEGAAEILDGRDNDCDGSIDENDGGTWWADCDGDGFAAPDAPSSDVSRLAFPPHGCTGAAADWTSRRPVFGSTSDCNDDNARVNPAQTRFHSKRIEGAPADLAFDYDCNGVEEPMLTTEVGSCTQEHGACAMDPGWVARPGCGAEAYQLERCHKLFGSGGFVCMKIPDRTLHVQACR